MSRLEELALARANLDLPKVPGNSVVEQLVNGREMAEAAIREHVGNLNFDEIDAEAVSSEVRAWEMRNEDHLEEIFKDTSKEILPDELQLELGATLMQQWVIAQFTDAARGLGPWMSGEVHRLVGSPEEPEINQTWAVEDAGIRLQIFRTILGMKDNGDLERIFNPVKETKVQMVSGAPIAIPIWAVVLIVVAIVGGIVTTIGWVYTIRVNNRIMDRICKKAQEDGNDEVVLACVDATTDLQAKSPYRAISQEVGKAVLWLGGGYLAIRYAFPWLLDKIGEAGFGKRP